MQDRPYTKYWITHFKNDPNHGYKRFKKLNVGYPPFEIDISILDIVGLDEFVAIEENRLPLFIGSQFGLYPNVNEMPLFFNGEKIIAILNKSLLSGTVAGLSLYKIGSNEKRFTNNMLYFYQNIQ